MMQYNNMNNFDRIIMEKEDRIIMGATLRNKKYMGMEITIILLVRDVRD